MPDKAVVKVDRSKVSNAQLLAALEKTGRFRGTVQ